MSDHDQDTKTKDDAIEIAEAAGEAMGKDEDEGKRKEGKLSYESELSTDEALNYLVSLIRGIKGGQVTLRQGDETLELEPSGTMALKVKASAKGRKEKLSFELAWRLPTEGDLEIE
jgi:amphi-Trp domain-containing protein